MILVDTSVWVEFLRATGSRADVTLAEWLEGEEDLVTSPFVIAELLSGVAEAEDRDELLAHLLAFPSCEPSWPAGWASVAALRRRARLAGTAVPLVDCVIATAALECGATVAHRDRDFERLAEVAGLRTLALAGPCGE